MTTPQKDFSVLNVLSLLLSFLLLASMGGSASAMPLPDATLDEKPANTKHEETIVLAGGCFWGVQNVFQHVKGVISATSGYAGGKAEAAHYEIVSSGETRHAESVRVTYDSSQITLGKILKVYFAVAHNPTELNHQGPDYGTQYRSAIFFANNEQKEIAEAYINQLQTAKVFSDPIVTKLEGGSAFYPAEDYHQNYAKLHPDNMYIVINDLPKVKNLQALFPELYVN